MDSRGAGRPDSEISWIADHYQVAEKVFLFRMLKNAQIRGAPAFAEAPARPTKLLEEGLRAARPKSFPPASLDLAFPWISTTGKEMLKSMIKVLT
jgi:hypothetical protein